MHIYAEFAPQGDYLALRRTGCNPVKGGRRGFIMTFSKASRSRMLRKISQVQKHRLPLFVTLTYPDNFPVNYKIFKRDLNAFFMDLKYNFSELGAIWKLEYQERGAAHYHIMLWGCDLEKAQTVIPLIWYRIAGGKDIKHLRWHLGELGNGNKNCVQAVRSWNGVKCYCSKYMTKEVDSDAPSGRYWGAVGHVPMSAIMSMRIDVEVALKYRRAVRKNLGIKGSGRFGFWYFGYHVDWLRFVDETQTDFENRNMPDHFPPGWWKSAERDKVYRDVHEVEQMSFF